MIIYEDKNKPKEPIKAVCYNCKSVLGIEEQDIIAYKEFDQREGEYFVDGFKCPCCNNEQRLRK
jgi:hypothetical protein